VSARHADRGSARPEATGPIASDASGHRARPAAERPPCTLGGGRAIQATCARDVAASAEGGRPIAPPRLPSFTLKPEVGSRAPTGTPRARRRLPRSPLQEQLG
jgi:hypothetical protein